jgi:hypothetical protein
VAEIMVGTHLLGIWCCFLITSSIPVIGLVMGLWGGTMTYSDVSSWAVTYQALYSQYATKGVRLQGRVVKTRTIKVLVSGGVIGEAEAMTVLYKVDQSEYTKEMSWPSSSSPPPSSGNINPPPMVVEPPSSLSTATTTTTSDDAASVTTMVDLVYLPGYPKSALFYEEVKSGAKSADLLPIVKFFTLFLGLFLCAFIPYLDNNSNNNTTGAYWIHPYVWLIAIGAIPGIVQYFIWGYWAALLNRDVHYQNCVYGADCVTTSKILLSSSSSSTCDIVEDPFEEWFQLLQPNHNLGLARKTNLQIAFEGSIWSVCWVPYLGFYLIWKDLWSVPGMPPPLRFQ